MSTDGPEGPAPAPNIEYSAGDEGASDPVSRFAEGTVAERFANLHNDPQKLANFAQFLEERGVLGELILSDMNNLTSQFSDGTNFDVEKLKAGSSDPMRNVLAQAIAQRLDKIDKNKDGILSVQELELWARGMAYQPTDGNAFAPNAADLAWKKKAEQISKPNHST